MKLLINPTKKELKFWDGMGFSFKRFWCARTQLLGHVVHHGDKFIELENKNVN